MHVRLSRMRNSVRASALPRFRAKHPDESAHNMLRIRIHFRKGTSAVRWLDFRACAKNPPVAWLVQRELWSEPERVIDVDPGSSERRKRCCAGDSFDARGHGRSCEVAGDLHLRDASRGAHDAQANRGRSMLTVGTCGDRSVKEGHRAERLVPWRLGGELRFRRPLRRGRCAWNIQHSTCPCA